MASWSRPYTQKSDPYVKLLEVRRIGATLLRSDVKTMEQILEEGFWDHAALLDPDTYVRSFVFLNNKRDISNYVSHRCKAGSLYLPIGMASDSTMKRLQQVFQEHGMMEVKIPFRSNA